MSSGIKILKFIVGFTNILINYPLLIQKRVILHPQNCRMQFHSSKIKSSAKRVTEYFTFVCLTFCLNILLCLISLMSEDKNWRLSTNVFCQLDGKGMNCSSRLPLWPYLKPLFTFLYWVVYGPKCYFIYLSWLFSKIKSWFFFAVAQSTYRGCQWLTKFCVLNLAEPSNSCLCILAFI